MSVECKRTGGINLAQGVRDTPVPAVVQEGAIQAIHESHAKQEILTGILFLNPAKPGFSEVLGATGKSLVNLPLDVLRPSREALERVMESMR